MLDKINQLVRFLSRLNNQKRKLKSFLSTSFEISRVSNDCDR